MTEKFKTLVHSVVASCSDPRRLGATRLNKICWFADSISFRKTGLPITAETYLRRQHGPVPKTILATLRMLESEGKIAIREGEGAYRTRLFFSLREPDTHVLSEDEKTLVAEITDDICGNHTANSISELSHNCVWEAANDGEVIPLTASLVGQSAQITDDILFWADGVVEALEGQSRAA